MDLATHSDGCYCATARKAARVVSRIYDRHLALVGMTIPQFSLLRIIGRAGELTAAELSDGLAMDRTTLVRALKPLQRDGLVMDRRASPNGRQLVFSLSEAGMAKVDLARPLWQAAQLEIEQQMGASRAATVRDDLRAAIAVLA